MKLIKRIWLTLFTSGALLLSGCTTTGAATEEAVDLGSIETSVEVETVESSEESSSEKESEAAVSTESQSAEAEQPAVTHDGYTLIEVAGGDQSGYREANAVVDIGFGDREYWAYTNEYGQLIRVVAEEIIPQNETTEPVNSEGRYYDDEAKVPGTEDANLDEGHVIADSLGGVANAYNITPQDRVLNRHGDQAYMEETIRQAGGATNFEAIITYPNTTTQVPSHYKYTYTIKGYQVVDEFANVNPDEYNEAQGITGEGGTPSSANEAATPEAAAPSTSSEGDISSVDANGNGIVTIQEAKNAGYSMPITSDHWLYQYMKDGDGDGQVGE